jgi:LmbE family N-acetylglucosaminyl deacetylase
MKTYLLPVVMLLFSYSGAQQENKPKVYLAILAHPDDEMAIAPVLAKYAEENTVYLLTSTIL